MFKMRSCFVSSCLLACFFLLAFVTGPARGNIYSITSVPVTNNTGSSLTAGNTGTFTIRCDVEFTCNGTCNMNLMINWNHNGMSIGNGSLFTVSSTVANSSTLTLVSPVRVSHAGVYNCTATLGSVSTSNSDETLTVIVPAPTVNTTNATADIGDSAQLTCTATFEDSLVTPVYSWSPLSGDTGSLTVAANLSTAGQHDCTVSPSYSGANIDYVMLPGFVVTPAFLNVTVTATATATATDTVIAGSSHTLNCETNAISGLNITYQWTNSAMNSVSSTSSYVINPVTTGHAGTYTCTVSISHSNEYVSILTPMTTDTVTLSVKFPTPSVSASTNITDNVLAGEDVQLMCAVALTSYNSSVYGSSFTINVTWDRGVGSMNYTSSMASQTFSHTLNDVATSDNGNYTCTAQVIGSQSNIVNSDESAASTTTLKVKIPPPTVTLSSVSVAVGTAATLTCTVSISSFVSQSDLSGLSATTSINSVISSVTGPNISNRMFTSNYTINNVEAANGTSYNCTAELSHANTTIITSDNGSGSGTLYVSSVAVTPETVTRLDVSPYNQFTLSCTVTTNPPPNNPPPNNPQISYTWMNDSNSQAYSEATDNMLAVTASVMGNFTYTCTPSVTVMDADGVAMPSNSTSVNIKGPSVPVQPLLIFPVMTTPFTATIRWNVSEVFYTPENYTITYSTDNFTNSTIANMTALDESLSFITDTNIVYSYTIQGLSSGIEYNFFITSTNTFGSSNSTTNDFTTSDAVPYPPNNANLTALNSSALQLTWDLPTPFTGTITDFNYTCSGINDTASYSSSDTERDNFISEGSRIVILSSLEPFREYSCNVTAATSAGVGPPATASGVTGQAAPSGPPLNFTIRPTNSSYMYLRLGWSLPSLETANGIITSYSYVCYQGTTSFTSDVVDGSVTSVDVTFTGIAPYTNYTCNVSASTVAGIGPAAIGNGRTAESAPTAVISLVLNRASDNSFNVMWSRPVPANGVITHYTVSIRYYSNTTAVKTDQNTTNTYLSIDQLRPEVPYVVSVRATTNGGTGPTTSQTNFTKEGEPGAVSNVNFQRISPTSVNVSWTPLTLEEAKGFITGYTVTLTPSTNDRRRQSPITMTARPDQSYVVFNGLSAEASYSISVSGSTAAGTGETSSGPSIPTAVAPSDDSTVVIVVVVVVLILIIILTAVVVILIWCYFRNRRIKGELTIEENTIALQEMKKGSTGDLNNGKEDEPELVAVNTDIDKERWEPVPVPEFAAHAAKLHSDRDLGFEDEYKSFKNIPQGSYTTAKLPDNVSKNRFENVFSYDSSRVELTAIPDKRGSDYINASFIDGYKRPKAYIAAQGPLSNTIGDFWRMVWEFQLPTIVMLTELIERGIDKCTCYWPRALNETMDVGYDLQVTLVEQQQYVDYKLKKFLLLNTSSTGGRLDVTHYHFLAWPDHGVPADKTIMLAFIRRVRQTHPPEGPPLIVHCSAGVGRTGTFITLDSMQQRLDKKEKDLNIYEFLANMRTKRVLMVQTEAQYVYIHDALSEYITCGDTSMTTKRLKIVMDELIKVSEQKSGYQRQLELINQVCRQPSEGLLCDALSKTNIGKNRFPSKLDTLPYDMTRVRLKTASGNGDYINANHVDGYKHRGAFLATQAPTTETVEDLWRMVWEQWSSSIVMLCNLEENEKEACAQYWPDKVDDSVTYGKMVVKLVSEEKRPHYIIRKLMLSQESTYINVSAGAADHLMVTQFHYFNWAEDDKPKDETPLLKLIDQLLHNQMNTGNKAITVMCSDGVGRTGCFMCMYSVLERIKIEGVADVFQYIKGARFNRPGLVQNVVQYEFCHDIILEYINSFDAYHNF